MCKSKKSCSCNVSKRVSLNESSISPRLLSKGLQWHINTGKPLSDTKHRVGSVEHKKLFVEARKLYSRGLLEIKDPKDLKYLKDKNYGYIKENFDSQKEKLQNAYKILGVENCTNQRKGYKNYIKVSYIQKSSPQTQQEDWVKIPYDDSSQLKSIFNELNLPQNFLKAIQESRIKKLIKEQFYSRQIREGNNDHVLDIEGNKVKDIPTDGDTRRTPTRRGDMDDEWDDLPPVPRGDMMESRIRKIVKNLGR